MSNKIVPILILSGTIIGAGIFGLPFAFYQAGLYAGLFTILFLGAIVAALHLVYADIITHTPGEHRFPGYAKYWLGKRGFLPAALINSFTLFGGLVVYLVLGSVFLSSFLSIDNSTALFFSWVIFSLSIIYGIRFFRSMEWMFSVAMVLLVITIFFSGLSRFDPSVSFFSPSLSHIFLLFGVILFALAGGSALPELKDYFTTKSATFTIVLFGTYIPIVLYMMFVLGVWGLSPGEISEDALSGMVGTQAIKLGGYVLGFLAITTSYWTLSTNLKNVLRFDLNLGEKKSIATVLLAPMLVVLLARSSFVTLMGFVGSIAIGFEVLMTLWIYKIMRKRREHTFVSLGSWAVAFMAALYLVGIIGNIIT